MNTIQGNKWYQNQSYHSFPGTQETSNNYSRWQGTTTCNIHLISAKEWQNFPSCWLVRSPKPMHSISWKTQAQICILFVFFLLSTANASCGHRHAITEGTGNHTVMHSLHAHDIFMQNFATSHYQVFILQCTIAHNGWGTFQPNVLLHSSRQRYTTKQSLAA